MPNRKASPRSTQRKKTSAKKTTKKTTPKKPAPNKRAAKKRAGKKEKPKRQPARTPSVRKKTAAKTEAVTKKKTAAGKSKAVGKTTAVAKPAAVAKRRVSTESQIFDTDAPARQERISGLAGQAGDLQGLSGREDVDSESVDELLEEGNSFEAGVVGGVEAADDNDEQEVHTHEVPEDDVPGEYLDEE
jgi:hypothetical protein